MDIFQEVLDAEKRIRPYILKTPLMESKDLGDLINGKVYLKLESEQYTGSFKARGSLNKILSLNEKDKEKGVITASTGNHALGYARALEITGVKGKAYLPENASKAKVAALKKYPVEIQFHGSDCLVTELHAKERARIEDKIWVSPYNDSKVIGGQGTIGIEIAEQLGDFDYLLATMGGGGLISGVGTYLKKTNAATKLVGCEPENSPEMTLSLEAGRIVEFEEARQTLSDASAGGIEEGAITFPVCQSIVNKTILVTEQEIESAIRFMAYKHHKIIEGAAGVALAGLIKNKEELKGSTAVIIISGSNIDIEKLKKII
jgi:threonine dehydratase